jgi:hypothetical protein
MSENNQDFEKLDDDSLLLLLDDGKTPEEAVISELLERNVGNDIVFYLFEYYPKFREKIWTEKINNELLRYIIVHMPQFRLQSIVRLCGRDLEPADLNIIIEYSPDSRNEAKEILAELIQSRNKSKAA